MTSSKTTASGFGCGIQGGASETAASAGQLAVVVALSPGKLLSARTQQVVMPQFAIKPRGTNRAAIAFNDTPVVREVSDAAADVLSASYMDGQVAINPLPVLQIEPRGATVVLCWPASLGTFLLQSAETLPPASWGPVALDIVTNGSLATVTVSATNAHRYFRLQGN